ncbi:hypothetical protein RND81_05G040200 [Saponaria officinalis]|uniref:Uncharacterized protein n=1 Tax=Saponaria officinalis TaxID=3572 RepID=A0AAW1KVA9_SAPOF
MQTQKSTQQNPTAPPSFYFTLSRPYSHSLSLIVKYKPQNLPTAHNHHRAPPPPPPPPPPQKRHTTAPPIIHCQITSIVCASPIVTTLSLKLHYHHHHHESTTTTTKTPSPLSVSTHHSSLVIVNINARAFTLSVDAGQNH